MNDMRVSFVVYVPASLLEQLHEASMALGISRSKLVRIALNYALQIGIERCTYVPTSVDTRFSFTLTYELYQKVTELAVRLGTSKADIIRSALACFLLVIKPYMGKFVEVNGVKVPAWAVEVLSIVATDEGKSTDEIIARAIVSYARKYAKILRVNIAVLNRALSARDSQS